MFERLFESSLGTVYFVFFILSTIFAIPVCCIFASSIKHKQRYEAYAVGEVTVAVMMLITFFIGLGIIFGTVITNNIDSIECFIFFIISEVLTFIFFLSYFGILYQRKRLYYGGSEVDHDCAKVEIAFDIVELLFEIFSIFWH